MRKLFVGEGEFEKYFFGWWLVDWEKWEGVLEASFLFYGFFLNWFLLKLVGPEWKINNGFWKVWNSGGRIY